MKKTIKIKESIEPHENLVLLERVLNRNPRCKIKPQQLAKFSDRASLYLTFIQTSLSNNQRSESLKVLKEHRAKLREFFLFTCEANIFTDSEFIKACRLSLGLSRSEFSQLIKVSKPTLTRFEKATTSPTLIDYRRILQVMGLELRMLSRNAAENFLAWRQNEDTE